MTNNPRLTKQLVRILCVGALALPLAACNEPEYAFAVAIAVSIASCTASMREAMRSLTEELRSFAFCELRESW